MTRDEALYAIGGRSAVNRAKALDRAPRVVATINVEPSNTAIDWSQADADMSAWLDQD